MKDRRIWFLKRGTGRFRVRNRCRMRVWMGHGLFRLRDGGVVRLSHSWTPVRLLQLI
ncbi:hypothetical protein GCM10011507_27950 [Edaphobacter acidisoli]|uniref:Uncharacterized protein n=1 Tax=Edaphobacter acidisoli TaxID=2040573 RepID=A0A916W7V7_9BACT|nr:hypothetical protein GCM10011507_27950 [Edaphobacter acidisoli]